MASVCIIGRKLLDRIEQLRQRCCSKKRALSYRELGARALGGAPTQRRRFGPRVCNALGRGSRPDRC
jgi:hypothetical protein